MFAFFVAILVLGEKPKKVNHISKYPQVRVTTFDRLKDLLLGKMPLNDLPVDDVMIESLVQRKRKRAKKHEPSQQQQPPKRMKNHEPHSDASPNTQQPSQQQQPKEMQDNVPHSDAIPIKKADATCTNRTPTGEDSTRKSKQDTTSISSGIASTQQSKPVHAITLLNNKNIAFDGEVSLSKPDLRVKIEEYGGSMSLYLTAKVGEYSWAIILYPSMV